jgi:hypothetical protein
MEQFIRLFTNYKQDDWDELLPAAEFAYNNHIHSSTQQVPFMTDTGRLPRMGFEPNGPRSKVESVNEFHDRIASGVSEAKAALVKAKEEYKRYYDRRRTPAPDIKVGDRVWLDASDIQTTRPSPELSHRRLGPFKVTKVVGQGAYKLELPPRLSRLHPVFPVVKLQLVEDDPFEGRPGYDEPAPVLPDVPGDAPEWEVEEILDAKIRYKSLWYMVRFKGYDESHNQWVKHSDVFADEAIAEFYRKYPSKPRIIAHAAFDSLPFRDPSVHVRSLRHMRRVAAFQGGGDVRGTSARPRSPGTRPRSSGTRRPVDRPSLRNPPMDPKRSLTQWHQVCDQARDICRSLRSCATSQ